MNLSSKLKKYRLVSFLKQVKKIEDRKRNQSWIQPSERALAILEAQLEFSNTMFAVSPSEGFPWYRSSFLLLGTSYSK